MPKHSAKAAIALLLLAVAALLWMMYLSAQTGISERTFQKIKIGMTEKEAINIIGSPPGDYRSEPPGFLLEIVRGHDFEEKIWISNEASIYLWIDAAGTVKDKLFDREGAPSLMSRIGDYLRSFF